VTTTHPLVLPSISPTRPAPTDATLATAELESAAGSGPPVVGLSALAAWAACGLAVAFFMQRRGHDGRALAGLGLALGPLLAPLAVHMARTRAPSVQARVLAPGRPGDGGIDVLVGFPDAVVDPGPLGGHLATLGLDDLDIGQVTVAGLLDDDDVRSARWIDSTADVARQLTVASDRLLAPATPRRVVVGGATVGALRQYAEAERCSVLVLVSTLQTEVIRLGHDDR
jgi:hypothetical protein